MSAVDVAQGTLTASNKRSDGQAVEMTGMQRMASKMWAPWIIMGLMIVGITFIIGLMVSSTAADYYANSKEAREAAVAGSDIVKDRGLIEVTRAWLPGFKFLGLGMMLGGITFLLSTILGNLHVQGGRVQQSLGVPVMFPKPPATAMLFRMLMMMGMMVLVVNFILDIWVATIAADYWNHSIATELNPASAGSDILRDLGLMNALNAWHEPLKFVGMAVLFSGIALALVTIVKTLQAQTKRMTEIVASAKGN